MTPPTVQALQNVVRAALSEIALCLESGRVVTGQMALTRIDQAVADLVRGVSVGPPDAGAPEHNTQTGESPDFERGICAVMSIRCRAHWGVPQMNANEASGAECAVCAVESARVGSGASGAAPPDYKALLVELAEAAQSVISCDIMVGVTEEQKRAAWHRLGCLAGPHLHAMQAMGARPTPEPGAQP